MQIVFDIEGDNLREECTKIFCVVAKPLGTNKLWRFYEDAKADYRFSDLPRLFSKCSLVVGHNIIGYDLPLLDRFFGIKVPVENIIDTYVWSVTLNPDRQLPKGCPTSIQVPGTTRLKVIGPHSLEAWGYRVGRRKIDYHDFSEFSDEMLKYCENDVIVNERVYYKLLEESGIEQVS